MSGAIGQPEYADQVSEGEGILDGVRIVDLSQGLAGPVATRILAEHGAEVLKIEPVGGDPVRSLCEAGYASWNRSKLGLVLDATQPAARSALEDLLAVADVLVHGMTQDEAAALGLDDDALAKRHPALVAASVTGYPHGHPDEHRPAREILIQARLGAMDEQQALRPGPMFVRMPFANWGAASLLAGGVVARLYERLGTGVGRPVRTSLLQAALAPASLYWQRAEDPPEWLLRNTLRRDDHPSNLTIFQCADDRWIHVLGGFSLSSAMTSALEEAGRPELGGQPVTLENQDQWASVFRARGVDDWCRFLWADGVICVPVLDAGEVLALEQTRVNGYAVDVDDAHFGRTVQAGSPVTTVPPARTRGGAPWTSVASVADLPESWRSPRPRRSVARGDVPVDGLSGIRVLDFGSFVAGPFGGQCLADFGADVIKVEPPWGERGRAINQFTGSQRGKRSLALDLQDNRSRELLRRLVSAADVVTHNIREAAARKLGIDEASVRAINPDIVYAHVSAYGAEGPWAAFGAFDPAAAALSGWTVHISGPGNRPTWLRNSAMDTHTGLNVFLAAALGLYQRATTGVAGRVGTSLLAAAVNSASESLLAGPDQRPTPIAAIDAEQTGVSPFYRIYRTQGRWVAVAAVSSAERDALLSAVGVSDPEDIAAAVSGRDAADLLVDLDAAGVPAELVAEANRDTLFDREIALGSGLIERTQTKPYGWFENPGGFWSDEHGVLRNSRPVPGVGEHTVEIMRQLDYSDNEIKEAIADGLVSDEQVSMPAGRSSNALTRSLNR